MIETLEKNKIKSHTKYGCNFIFAFLVAADAVNTENIELNIDQVQDSDAHGHTWIYMW